MFYDLDEQKVKLLCQNRSLAVIREDVVGFGIGKVGDDYLGIILNFPATTANLHNKTFDIAEVRLNGSVKGYKVSINPKNAGYHLIIAHGSQFALHGGVHQSCAFLRQPKEVSTAYIPNCMVSDGLPIAPAYVNGADGMLIAWKGARLYDVKFSVTMSCEKLCNINRMEGICSIEQRGTEQGYKAHYVGGYYDIRRYCKHA